jgi:hypothetical protein
MIEQEISNVEYASNYMPRSDGQSHVNRVKVRGAGIYKFHMLGEELWGLIRLIDKSETRVVTSNMALDYV